MAAGTFDEPSSGAYPPATPLLAASPFAASPDVNAVSVAYWLCGSEAASCAAISADATGSVSGPPVPPPATSTLPAGSGPTPFTVFTTGGACQSVPGTDANDSSGTVPDGMNDCGQGVVPAPVSTLRTS